MKTDNISIESEKKIYLSPVIESIKLDNEISLILNSFGSLPGDPSGPGCEIESNQFHDNPWE